MKVSHRDRQTRTEPQRLCLQWLLAGRGGVLPPGCFSLCGTAGLLSNGTGRFLGAPSQGRRPGCASVSNWPRALRRFRPLAASFWLFMAWCRLQSHWRFVRSSLPPSSWGVRWSSSRGPAHGPRLACWHEWSSSRVAVSRVRFHSLVDVREFPLVNAMVCAPLSPALAPGVPLPPAPGGVGRGVWGAGGGVWSLCVWWSVPVP